MQTLPAERLSLPQSLSTAQYLFTDSHFLVCASSSCPKGSVHPVVLRFRNRSRGGVSTTGTVFPHVDVAAALSFSCLFSSVSLKKFSFNLQTPTELATEHWASVSFRVALSLCNLLFTVETFSFHPRRSDIPPFPAEPVTPVQSDFH